MTQTTATPSTITLPGLDCGLCGFRQCSELAARLATQPQLIKRCIHLADETVNLTPPAVAAPVQPKPAAPDRSVVAAEPACAVCAVPQAAVRPQKATWRDSLGREFDFYLEHFPEDPGPREVIIPHNPMLTREMNIQPGDVLIGRPLGMSCGCPITHCGTVQTVDHRTGVLTWCITGPLNPRQSGYKDLGYYIAEAYEGLIYESRCEIKLGLRYFFQPHMCMLQWRHSGLINYVNRTPEGWQIRIEGLWIG